MSAHAAILYIGDTIALSSGRSPNGSLSAVRSSKVTSISQSLASKRGLADDHHRRPAVARAYLLGADCVAAIRGAAGSNCRPAGELAGRGRARPASRGQAFGEPIGINGCLDTQPNSIGSLPPKKPFGRFPRPLAMMNGYCTPKFPPICRSPINQVKKELRSSRRSVKPQNRLPMSAAAKIGRRLGPEIYRISNQGTPTSSFSFAKSQCRGRRSAFNSKSQLDSLGCPGRISAYRRNPTRFAGPRK